MIVYLKLIASMFIWGGTWIAGRVVAPVMDPYVAAFLRFLVASIYLVLLSSRMEHHLPRLPKGHLLQLALLGVSGVFAYNALFFTGLQTVSAGRASLIIAVVPACIALSSRLFFKERLGWVRAVGIPISLFGVVLILTGGHPGLLLGSGAEGMGHGEWAILGCVVAWTAYSLLGKRAMGKVSPLVAVLWSCVLGDAMLLIPALSRGLFSQAMSASFLVWACLIFLGVLATGIAFAWYYEGIQAIGAARAGIFINLVPVAAVSLGVLILDEQLTLSMVLGGAMVFFGVWLTSKRGRPAGVSPTPSPAAVMASSLDDGEGEGVEDAEDADPNPREERA